MTLRLEQVFFGCGKRGYAILGASHGATRFAARVESVCGAVGTPSGDYNGEPFLLSVPNGDYVIMVCGRPGFTDSMGRTTLFFHALIAGKTTLAAVNVDAFALYGLGMFVDRMPTDGVIAPVTIEPQPCRDTSAMRQQGEHAGDVFPPCVIRSDKPVSDLVRIAVGEQVHDLAWATFAFQALDGFIVQVLPPRISVPIGFNEYDAAGQLLHAISPRPDVGYVGSAGRSEKHGFTPVRPRHTSQLSAPGNASVMFKISLIANLVFLATCFVLLATRKTEQSSPKGLPSSNPPKTDFILSHDTVTNSLDTNTIPNSVVVTNPVSAPALPSPEIIDNVRNEARKKAFEDFARAIPREEIDACLKDLVGSDEEKKKIREWLDTYSSTNGDD